jgi:hypothetical protein
MFSRICVLAVLLMSAGCTSVKVEPISQAYKISHLCIEENPRIIYPSFVRGLQHVLTDQGVTTQLYSGNLPAGCVYYMTYSAIQSYDMKLYLSHAELNLYKGPQRVGTAQYHLLAEGGLALNKWDSIENKLAPVMDQLFGQTK